VFLKSLGDIIHKRRPHKIAKIAPLLSQNVRAGSAPSPFVRADTINYEKSKFFTQKCGRLHLKTPLVRTKQPP